MLRISAAQAAALGLDAENTFRDKLHARLTDVLNGEQWPADKITRHIEMGLNRAQSYGFLRTEAEMAEYIEIVCCYLGGFGRAPHPPEVMLMLFDRSRPAAARLSRIRAWCTEQ